MNIIRILTNEFKWRYELYLTPFLRQAIVEFFCFFYEACERLDAMLYLAHPLLEGLPLHREF